MNAQFVARQLSEGFFCTDYETQSVLLAKVCDHEILVGSKTSLEFNGLICNFIISLLECS